MQPIRPRQTNWRAQLTELRVRARRAGHTVLAWVRNPQPLGRRRTAAIAALSLMLGLIAATGVWMYAGSIKNTRASGGPASGFMTFYDTKNHTSFRVGTDLSNAHAGIFSLMIPTGEQYYGGGASDIAATDEGTLSLHFTGNVHLYPALTTTAGRPTSVQIRINATIDPVNRRATAELSDDTRMQHFVMVTTIPDNAAQVVNSFEQAMINQDWATVYAMTSHALLGAMTEQQFAQLMQQNVANVGTVTAMTVTSAPQVATDDNGSTSFTVTEAVSYTNNGASQTASVTSVYVLEDGVWKLLSSQ